MSEGLLSLPASIVSANPANNIYASLFLYEDNIAIISWQVFSSGSLSDTVTLNPGHDYRFVAALQSDITETPTTQSGSASSTGISLSVSAVPEPTSLALVALGLGTMLARRRRPVGGVRQA